MNKKSKTSKFGKGFKTREEKRKYERITSRRYRERHPERRKETVKKSYEKIRFKVLSHYGGNPPKCKNCGFDDMNALTLDHIKNNGAEHRRQIGCRGGYSYYNWFVKNNFPDGYQVLCANCNQIKEVKRRKKYDIRYF